MADWIYCGTDPPVDAGGTQALLRARGAIWCPPPGMRPWPGRPRPGDRLWLAWRDPGKGSTVVLGGGRLVGNGREKFGTDVLHSDADAPGVRDEARKVGFGGPNNMSFLLLRDVAFPRGDANEVPGIGAVATGLSIATSGQVAVIGSVVPVEVD